MKICYSTTQRLIARQKRFWAEYPEMRDTKYKLAVLPIGKVFIDDEWPDPSSLPPYRAAIRAGKPFPPVLVMRPARARTRFRVVDGKHRYEACRRERATHIPVLVEVD